MTDRPIVQLPSMPAPGEYGYDPKGNDALNRRAKDAYEEALRVWERVITTFAASHTLEPKDR